MAIEQSVGSAQRGQHMLASEEKLTRLGRGGQVISAVSLQVNIDDYQL